MNFFEAQDSARRSTSLLVLLFVLAVVALLVLSNVIVFEFMYFMRFSALTFSLDELEQVYDSNLSILLCAAIIGFITLGSLYKLVMLSSGGSAIEQHLGGVIIPRSSSNSLHKKILNVVEEMAIAAGMPVPEVYVMDRDEPLRLSRRSYALRLLQYVRDEAHRFAQHYHHLWRRKRTLGD